MDERHKPTWSFVDRPAKPFGWGMIWKGRPWVNFYGGDPPPNVAASLDLWYTMFRPDCSCVVPGFADFSLPQNPQNPSTLKP